MLQSIKERHVFTQILENENSKLIFLFNNDMELLYQNREVPTNLKYLFFFKKKFNFFKKIKKKKKSFGNFGGLEQGCP